MFKLTINGFGRIGRAVFKEAIRNYPTVDLFINDVNLTDEDIVYLLNYDSTGQGWKSFADKIITYDSTIPGFEVKGKKVVISHDDTTAMTAQGNCVIDCTGINSFTIDEYEHMYMGAGFKAVFLCGIPRDSSINQIVYGVNQDNMKNYTAVPIFSLSSCTTQAMALILAPIQESYGITTAIGKAIRSYTNDQALMDNGDAKGRMRAAAVNIIPTETGAGKAMGKVVTTLNGKVLAQAFRTPTILGGAVDLTIQIDKSVTKAEIIKTLSNYKYSESITTTSENLVSSDIIGDTHAVTVLENQTLIVNNLINIVGLYDNENGYAAQALRTIDYYFNNFA